MHNWTPRAMELWYWFDIFLESIGGGVLMGQATGSPPCLSSHKHTFTLDIH
jgi:hypothetical protein